MSNGDMSVAAEQWDAGDVAGSLLSIGMPTIMRRTADEAPHSPLFEYVESKTARGAANVSPALSYASEDSLDSILTSTANSISEDLNSFSLSEEEADTNRLIYRLCRSLYKKALQKTIGRDVNRSTSVDVDARRELNMSRMMDWMPLLHLFDPKTFYAYRAETAEQAAELPVGLQRANNAREASRWLMSELEVEKLSGGNSNHVYRLGHPQFPEKTILLRVYGGGDDDAIDRYRDVAAMKQTSKAQLAPAVLHTFKWGRVEEFMDKVATGSTDMLIDSPRLLSETYEVLHGMHQLPVEPFYPQVANAARFKSNSVLSVALREKYEGPDDYMRQNAERLREELASAGKGAAGTSYFAEDAEVKVLEDICPTAFERASLRFLRLMSPSVKDGYRGAFVRFAAGEVMDVRRHLQRLSIPVVFSHNDVNPANILLSWRKVPKKFRDVRSADSQDGRASVCVDDDDEVTAVVSDRSNALSRKFLTKKGHHMNLVELKGIVFIDFEYSDANYRAFDLGNTLYELDYDYSRGTEDGGPGFIKYLHAFPPDEFRERWADEPMWYPRLPELLYTAWERQHEGGGADQQLQGIGASCLQAVAAYFRMDEAANGDSRAGAAAPLLSRRQITEVLLGMLSCQLHWALWSFTFACNTDTYTNQTSEDDTFAKGSSGLDYVRYGDCRLKEYLFLKSWLKEKNLI